VFIQNKFQDDHDIVAESAVVGFPHDFKGEGVYAYVVLKESGSTMTEDEKKALAAELRSIVKQKISGFAVPEKIQVIICSYILLLTRLVKTSYTITALTAFVLGFVKHCKN
jgi:acyl-CoA synthetase (AMP-forming)/AMP-acid ligase II